MSANNQLIITRKKDKFQIHENFCMDNDFEPDKASLLKTEKTLEEAIKFANKYCQENIVEYGYHISNNCLTGGGKK